MHRADSLTLAQPIARHSHPEVVVVDCLTLKDER